MESFELSARPEDLVFGVAMFKFQDLALVFYVNEEEVAKMPPDVESVG